MAMATLDSFRSKFRVKEITDGLTTFVGDCISNGLIPELAAEGKDPIPPVPQNVYFPRALLQFISSLKNQKSFGITDQEAAYLLVFANKMIDSGVLHMPGKI